MAIIDLQPDFSYVSVPRVSPHSFLQAKVKNTSPYAILNGSSNVFLDNNFLAKVHVHVDELFVLNLCWICAYIVVIVYQ